MMLWRQRGARRWRWGRPRSWAQASTKPCGQTAEAQPKSAACRDQPGRKKQPPHRPSKDAYAAMPMDERLAIQSDLIWSGDYNGGVTGEFGDRAIAAVKAFQKSSKGQRNRHPDAGRTRGFVRGGQAASGAGRLEDGGGPGDGRATPRHSRQAPQRSLARQERRPLGLERAAKCRSKPSAKMWPTRRSSALFEQQKKTRPTARSNTACCVRISSCCRDCRV